ncbi:RNA polymerase sigma factor [Oscillibacter sp.]|uniref:RNA polymerase sigma factor n=1 Tax=Oscillibacter sp. TaxID=1945593 RepID=UPI00217355C2|nr:RNA polymerase sigma factor [Oscillibacter sp.]MCI9649913.1 RNA polymerase sigma factor [Oscillibacter sp.]
MDSQDRTALMEQWYRQYAPLLFHYARQFVDYHAAEEVVQETFRVAWEAIWQREVQYPKTWLRKIAENIIRNRLRQQDRRKDLLSGADALPEDEWEDPVDVELEYNGVISRRDLHLLKRLAVDGCTYAEAAQELHTTAEACRKRAARAKQLLRKLLEE